MKNWHSNCTPLQLNFETSINYNTTLVHLSKVHIWFDRALHLRNKCCVKSQTFQPHFIVQQYPTLWSNNQTMEPIPQQSDTSAKLLNTWMLETSQYPELLWSISTYVAHRTENNTSLLIGLEKISTKSMRLKHCTKIFLNTRLWCLTDNWVHLLNTNTFGSVI